MLQPHTTLAGLDLKSFSLCLRCSGTTLRLLMILLLELTLSPHSFLPNLECFLLYPSGPFSKISPWLQHSLCLISNWLSAHWSLFSTKLSRLLQKIPSSSLLTVRRLHRGLFNADQNNRPVGGRVSTAKGQVGPKLSPWSQHRCILGYKPMYNLRGMILFLWWFLFSLFHEL